MKSGGEAMNKLSESKKRGCPTCDGVDARSCLRCRGKTRMCDWYNTDTGWAHYAARDMEASIDAVQPEASTTLEQAANADALLDALRQIAEWPDGGNRYGQGNIKRFAQAAIDNALSKSGDWPRALRIADDAAKSVICTVGRSPCERQWVLYPEQIAADPYLEDAIAHLEWRGIAKAIREDGRVTVIFEEQR